MSTWFKPITFVSDDGAVLLIGVPSSVFGDRVMMRYGSFVEQALAELDRKGTVVSYVIEAADPSRTRPAATTASLS
ncbi:MAG: DnaA N-terminal domain-containing protein [Vicinamibacterales bacterium]